MQSLSKSAEPAQAGQRPASASAPRSAQGAIRGSAAYRRITLALFCSGFATFSLLYCVQPLLPEFAREFNVGAAGASLALSLSTALLALSIALAGIVSERYGRKELMFASMAVAACCNLLAAVAPSWHMILAARALEGFALGGVPAVAMAYLSEEIDHSGLGFSMGLYVSGNAFGGMMGRVAMSMLAESFGWRSAMLAIGALDLALAVAFVLLLPASRNFVRNGVLKMRDHLALWRGHFAHGRLPLVFGIGALAMGIFATSYNYAGFRLMGAPFSLSATATGLIFSAYIFGIVSSSWAGALADRFGRAPLVAAGIGISCLGLLLTCSSVLGLVIAGIVCLTIGFFTTHSAASSWVGRMAVTGKGHAASLYLLAYYLGGSILGSVGGWFWEHSGWNAVAGFMLLQALAAGWLARRLWRQGSN
ncbi:MFS transporter [Herbaspirillum sp. LeCh32-8]|uniref:MFS transporter n=1 Tax=Herbaspirillum sp. LeCh32-8 TaxID=2821356 RepID=UPI001AEA7FF3|nr:MFS transporter [Herbaspirillum sp. LeCh32-8]MBP0599029.1 MFS transporter [Herbaspirillum sp. LeCh32-8]